MVRIGRFGALGLMVVEAKLSSPPISRFGKTTYHSY